MTADDKLHASRDALLIAAKRLFSERGFEAVSTRDLAEAAGVNLGAIQYHYGSKSKLFIDAVVHLMNEEGCMRRFEAFGENITSRDEAAERLCSVVLSFLDDIMHTEGPQPCRIMFREILSESSEKAEMCDALVGAALDNFIAPVDRMLVGVLSHLRPDLAREEIERHAQSVVGQCSFYFTHAPFVARLRGSDCAAPPHFARTVRHIAAYSLRALGCDEAMISRAVENALSDARIRAAIADSNEDRETKI